MKLIIDIPEEIRNETLEYGVLFLDYVFAVGDAIKNGTPLDDVKAEIEQMPIVLLNGFDHIDRTDTLEIIDKHISGEGDKE